MAISTNIARRPGSSVYYARLGIPPDLQCHYPAKRPGKTKLELWKSLGTRDARDAREKVLPVLMHWRAEFAELRKRREPTPDDLQNAVWTHYESEMEHDRRARAALPTAAMVQEATDQLTDDTQAGRVAWSDDPIVQLNATVDLMILKDAASLDAKRRAVQLAELRKHLATGETALIEWAADDVIQRERLLVEKGSPAYRDLCQRLQRAQIQALERAAERDTGKFDGVATDPLVAPPDLTMGNKFALPGESIMELYDRFKAEKVGSATPDTWDQNRKIVKLFAEFVGETSHPSAVTRKAVRDWKHKLSLWPRKAADIKVFDGLSFRKIIDANVSAGKPTISQKTVNKYLSAVGSFATWLLQNEFLEIDVMAGMYLSLNKREKKVFPYTAEQLKIIFASPLFATCMGDDHEHKPGNVAVRDWRYWIPWIGLYSGARLGEISQLSTVDVRQLHGVWVMHVTEEGSQLKSTKTAGSMRVVPIHSELIKLGLIDYHAAIVARGETQLFPEIKPDSRGYFSGDPSAFFNDYFRAIGVKVDKTVNFHSLRHGIADAFRSAGYMDEQFNMLLGHTKATTTGRYGILPEGILSERVKMIEAVSFPGL
jgi:site-specific recombinase XerD